jgi:riboflavin kinase/FMN adenylyltransferase
MSALSVFRSLEEAAGGFPPCSVTIGNFDGVHIGHRELMRRTVAHARQLGVKPSVITFHPHPATIVHPERTPRLLTTPDERCLLMAAEGIEQVLILPFTYELSQIEPAAFFERILCGSLGARAITVGANFRFGHGQSGEAHQLSELAASSGVVLDVVPLLRCRGVAVSSSEIRRLLAAGDVGRAGRLLERPYWLIGDVVPGAGRGSRETVPTLNLETGSLDDSLRALPRDGVYITRTTCTATGRQWESITNSGHRPTFEGRHLTIETFLLSPFDGDAPATIRLEFLRRVRDERRFENAEALRAQILRDVSRATSFFRRLRGALGRQIRSCT